MQFSNWIDALIQRHCLSYWHFELFPPIDPCSLEQVGPASLKGYKYPRDISSETIPNQNRLLYPSFEPTSFLRRLLALRKTFDPFPSSPAHPFRSHTLIYCNRLTSSRWKSTQSKVIIAIMPQLNLVPSMTLANLKTLKSCSPNGRLRQCLHPLTLHPILP